MHAPTRAALGVDIRQSVVVVDEAHNLIDTLNEMHTVTASARQLSEASAQLAQYAERYHARLKPANRMCVQQLLHVVRALRHALLPAAATATATAAATPTAVPMRFRRVEEAAAAPPPRSAEPGARA